jgi:predicted metal-binding membrane protein
VIEDLLRRDRLVVLASLLAVTALAWVYLIQMAIGMNDMPSMGDGGMSMGDMATTIKPWTAVDGVMMFIMWAIMMVAMMLPSAAPMILIFARVNNNQRDKGNAYVPTVVFASGYILVWALFSAAATVLQWGLQQTALLSPMMVSTSSYLGGGLFILAGVYQWTPLKQACLKHCRSPLAFVMHHWRAGSWGAFRMGLGHGAFCLGCCWSVMALLFVGGVMNLIWVAVITIFVAAEKLIPYGPWAGRITGLAMIAMGVYLLV